ncbi:MAG: Gfo/Idh/MocA family oxidoreductase, partial [Cyclobacteriaceae bacterium]|nr:Gfo/Idh/MocA family oxidoreductase [Cyclobacteriaceae bacterium]
MNKPIRILVIGCGNMGASHATAYHHMPEFEICGLVARGESKNRLNQKLNAKYPLFDDFDSALEQAKPDAVCISTYPDTHEEFAVKALDKGCHIFIEKPLADTIEGSQRIIDKAKEKGKKV